MTQFTNLFSKKVSSLLSPRFIVTFALLIIIGAGLGIRILDLTDPPLDFHAWRQLRAAIITRGKYYSMDTSADPNIRLNAMELGAGHGRLEPEIFETLVAITYRLIGREELWIARVYSILFWMIGGIFLYLLSRKISSMKGALISLAYYLLVPFGVIGSRSFLPEPLMIMWVLISAWCLYRWSDNKNWMWTVLLGITGGVAILIKVFAVFPIGCAAVAVVLSKWGIKRAVRDPQIWSAAAIMGFIPATYYIFPSITLGVNYVNVWFFSFSYLLLQPGFYVRWFSVLHDLVNLFPLLASLIGVTLLKGQGRSLAFGLWLGYWIFGISVPSQIRSHTYYNLVLVPILALPLAPIGDFILSRLAQLSLRWRLYFIVIGIATLAYPAILARNELVAKDYRAEVIGWTKIADILPEGRMIGLTHDYGNRIAYYAWRKVDVWPNIFDFRMQEQGGGSADPMDPEWASILKRRIELYDYFVVTVISGLEAQPVVKSTLFSTYEIYTDENGVLIFDLNKKR
jgi:hypothetical protein